MGRDKVERPWEDNHKASEQSCWSEGSKRTFTELPWAIYVCTLNPQVTLWIGSVSVFNLQMKEELCLVSYPHRAEVLSGAKDWTQHHIGDLWSQWPFHHIPVSWSERESLVSREEQVLFKDHSSDSLWSQGWDWGLSVLCTVFFPAQSYACFRDPSLACQKMTVSPLPTDVRTRPLSTNLHNFHCYIATNMVLSTVPRSKTACLLVCKAFVL